MNIKRSTPFWIFLFIIVVLSLAAMPLALAGDTDEPVSSNEAPVNGGDAARFDAEIYAEHFKVTVDEAVRRLELQDVVGELDAEVTVKEAATFAGLWIEHTPSFKVVVLFTSNAEATIEPYLQRYPELAGIIEVRTAEMSLVEMQDVQQAFGDALENLGIINESWVDVYENRVKFCIVDQLRLDLALLEGGLILPNCVDVIIVAEFGGPD